ncbi:MAG: NAD-dependent epimerase/dehydratase family protein [Verrucomicrobiae bacterium]|nr:NAD-dependent epimerase/dehydratase family protein [Verrucomicrobiae bacterium]
MNQTHLVTGAAGFIGSHLVDRLLSLGYRVIGIDNLSLGQKKNLTQALAHPHFIFHEQDLNQLENCLRLIEKEKIDTLWHLAANSDIQAGVKNPDIDLHATFLTTYNALKLAKHLQIPHFAFSSTSAIYGELPGNIAENAGPLFPISSYGAMKLASEAVISVALESYLQKTWIFRFPNVVGPRATHGVIFDFIKKLKKTPTQLEVLGDGNQTKPYLYVTDLVNAMIFIHQNAQKDLNYFNIAPQGSETSVRHIAQTLLQHIHSTAAITFTGGSKGWTGDVANFRYDVTKLSELGWIAQLTSDQAIQRAIQDIWNENS